MTEEDHLLTGVEGWRRGVIASEEGGALRKGMGGDALDRAELVLTVAGEDQHEMSSGEGGGAVAMTGGVDGKPKGEEGGEGAGDDREEVIGDLTLKGVLKAQHRLHLKALVGLIGGRVG